MLERKEQCVTIFRGDDTGGQLGKTIVINFHCGNTVNMEGVVVTFILGGFYEKEFHNVHDGDRLEIFMTHEQTAMLPLGVSFGKLYGTDASGKIRTFSNRIPIRVTNHVREAYGDSEDAEIDVTISNAITWDSIFGKPETFPPSEHRHQKSDIDGLEADLQTLSDGVESAIEAAEAAKTEAAKGVRTVNSKAPTGGNVKIVLDDLADKDGNIETTKNIMVSRDGGESHAAVALLSDLTSEIDTHNNDVRAHTPLVATITKNFATKTEVDAKADKSALQAEVDRAQAAEAQLTTKANELDTAKADKSALNAHVNNKDNPHAVTADQVGAVPLVEDRYGNKTAVTVGSRKSGSIVGQGSFAAGFDVSASEDYSHAEGQETNASGLFSHAEGFVTTAEGFASHTEGGKARTLSGHTLAFAWNGDNSRSEDDPYTSHGEGTFNVNPVGGLGGFWIGEQTLDAIINAAVKNKADSASLALEYSATSAYSVGAIVYHDGNIYQCKTAIAAGGEAWNAAHWELRKLDDFFTESNSLLTGTIDARLPYPLYSVPSTGLLKDRAINTTSLASVTVPENFTDLLIRASVASSLSVTMPSAITTKYGDTFPGEAGEYLITITKTGASEAYVRTIKLEVANA